VLHCRFFSGVAGDGAATAAPDVSDFGSTFAATLAVCAGSGFCSGSALALASTGAGTAASGLAFESALACAFSGGDPVTEPTDRGASGFG
jgi:hypothetical protein